MVEAYECTGGNLAAIIEGVPRGATTSRYGVLGRRPPDDGRLVRGQEG